MIAHSSLNVWLLVVTISGAHVEHRSQNTFNLANNVKYVLSCGQVSEILSSVRVDISSSPVNARLQLTKVPKSGRLITHGFFSFYVKIIQSEHCALYLYQYI